MAETVDCSEDIWHSLLGVISVFEYIMKLLPNADKSSIEYLVSDLITEKIASGKKWTNGTNSFGKIK